MKAIMNIWKNIGVICCALSLFVACKDYESEFTAIPSADETVFNGSILEYLELGDPNLGLRFDSMLVVINGVPGLRDSLANTTEEITVFAVPNTCFQEAMLRLNNYREAKGKGRNLYLMDFLIEPFVVIEEQEGPTRDSIIIIEHHYDYRSKLDSLVSRYIFRGRRDTKILFEYTNGLHTQAFKFEYLMHILFERQYASGIGQMGRKRLILSDKNETQLVEAWDRSETQVIDVRTNNGYIHVLSNGHEFGFSKLIANFQNYGNEYIYD
jgi:hypothetical protein